MKKICIADNFPVVLNGLKQHFESIPSVNVVATASNLEELLQQLQKKDIDVIVMDIDLSGVHSVRDVKALLKDFPSTKIVIFTNVSENMYAPTLFKAGVSAYITKTTKLKDIDAILIKVANGEIVISENAQKQIELLGRGKKSERLFKKLSTRETEVLRYLNDGKKNKEVAEILGLDEKTISTYKLRLLAKLNVTNLVDLLHKAKSLNVI
jgi:DNA-binding NarL/FixJ family response regulator